MNIPIYNVLINDIDCGIDRISLVESPAVKSNFLAFAKDKKQVMFNVNEEQQMVTGVLIRCDYPIYRNDVELGEYYLNFDNNTIKLMAEKLLVDGHQNWVNLEHMDNSDVDGVHMIQLFIKDTTKGINPIGFEDITDGSLFATFKVNNQEIWEMIKNSTFKGFSIEGMFGIEKQEDKELDEILNLLNKIIKKSKK